MVLNRIKFAVYGGFRIPYVRMGILFYTIGYFFWLGRVSGFDFVFRRERRNSMNMAAAAAAAAAPAAAYSYAIDTC